MEIYLFILNLNLFITAIHSSETVADNELKRNKRTVGNSCPIPSASHDKTITYRCDGKESQTCGTEEGYIPEYTVALIKCKSNYIPEGKAQSVSSCFRSSWRPAIDNCVKLCEKLTPINVDLQCYRKGANIPCEANSTLLTGTKVQPTCKLLHKYTDKIPNYKEITCKDDGKWDRTLFSCTPECGKPYTDPAHLIAGGTEERFGDSPWHVAIYNRKKILICGGTIITLDLVVSAAHCFHDQFNNRKDPSDYEVVVSKFSRNYTIIDNDNQKAFQVKDIRYSNKGYVGLKNHFAADIAILILQEKITISPTVLPACVDWIGLNVTKYPPEGTPAKVVGWGMNEHRKFSENLTTADLPFISRERCLNTIPSDEFKKYITFDKFCAGSETGATVLQGDSGGGLLFRTGPFYYLRGVVSLKQPSFTAIAAFTDIADHIEWIIEIRNEVEQELIKAKLSLLQASHNEMKTGGGQEDIMKLYDLSERLKKEVIDDEKITYGLKSQAQSFYNTVRNSMQKLAVEKISDAFLNDRLSNVSQLGSDLVNTCYACFNQIIDKVINNVLSKIGTKELLILVRKPNGFCCIPELIAIYTAVFRQLERNGEINTNSIIQLAHLIREIMGWENYANVESSVRSQMEHIKNKLPKSVKNIVFSAKICIKNSAYDEYLFAAGPQAYWRDQDRRYVFTWKGGDRSDPDEPGKFAWKLERDGDNYEIINSQYNEHLYAGGYNKGSDRRGVLTWRKGGPVTQSSWQFEPIGDEVYIKNINHQEYMFGDSHEIRDGTRRYVFTFIPQRKTYDSRWEIIDCPDQ